MATIILMNKHEILLNEEEASNAKQQVINGAKWLDLGDLVATSSIVMIRMGGSAPQLRLDEDRQIGNYNKNRRASTESEGYKKFQERKKEMFG